MVLKTRKPEADFQNCSLPSYIFVENLDLHNVSVQEVFLSINPKCLFFILHHDIDGFYTNILSAIIGSKPRILFLFFHVGDP